MEMRLFTAFWIMACSYWPDVTAERGLVVYIAIDAIIPLGS